MSSDRREFLGKAAAVTAALGARALPPAAQRAATMPTPRASALMELFGLRYPIFSAGMGATAVPELAIAVSNAGGLGAIGTTIKTVPDVSALHETAASRWIAAAGERQPLGGLVTLQRR